MYSRLHDRGSDGLAAQRLSTSTGSLTVLLAASIGACILLYRHGGQWFSKRRYRRVPLPQPLRRCANAVGDTELMEEGAEDSATVGHACDSEMDADPPTANGTHRKEKRSSDHSLGTTTKIVRDKTPELQRAKLGGSATSGGNHSAPSKRSMHNKKLPRGSQIHAQDACCDATAPPTVAVCKGDKHPAAENIVPASSAEFTMVTREPVSLKSLSGSGSSLRAAHVANSVRACRREQYATTMPGHEWSSRALQSASDYQGVGHHGFHARQEDDEDAETLAWVEDLDNATIVCTEVGSVAATKVAT